ncbi:MAG: pilus assembly protein CpaE, partial [Brevundimonas sp.]
MSTAPVPREFDAFEDGFDVDMDFSEPTRDVEVETARAPLQFTAAAPVPSAPVAVAPAYVPEAIGFNPVGDVVAQAQASLT